MAWLLATRYITSAGNYAPLFFRSSTASIHHDANLKSFTMQRTRPAFCNGPLGKLVAACLIASGVGVASGQTLVHQWSFEDNFNDTSGSGNTGSAVGAPTFIDGQFGRAVSLTGADGVENLFAANIPTLSTDSWSINLWTNFSAAPAALSYVGGFGVSDDFIAGDEGRARGFLSFGGAGSNIYFWGAANDLDSGTPYPVDGDWHMQTVTYDSSSSLISVYNDGSLLASSPAGTAFPFEDTFPQVQVGNPSVFGSAFVGGIDEFSVYSGALSEAQIGGLFFFNDSTQSVTVDPTLTVNRDTGEIILNNSSSFDLDILGYTVRSDSGSLDPSAFDTIAGRLDGSPGGDGSVASDAWTVLTDDTLEFNLEFSEGAPGTLGGTVAVGSSISFGAGAWIGSPAEDISIELLLNDGEGTIRTIGAEYIGNGGESYDLGDLDADGDIDTDDFALFLAGSDADTSAFFDTQAYLGGDLNGDGRKDISDFVLFESVFDAANGGPGALAAAISAPEPSALLLLAAGLVAATGLRKNRMAVVRAAGFLAVAVVAFGTPGAAQAQLQGYYQLNGNADEATGGNTNLTMVNGAAFGGSLHPGLGTAFVGDGVDDAAIGQNFVPVTGNDLSVVAWVFAETNDSLWDTIAKNWGEFVEGQFHFGLGQAEANTLNNFAAQGTGNSVIESGEDLAVGEWVHTAFVLDSVAGTQTLYINGVAEPTTVAYDGVLGTNTATGFGIGGKPNDDGSDVTPGFGFWDGAIDEVGIYSTALTGAEIQSIVDDALMGVQLDGTTQPFVEIEVDRGTGEVMLQNNTSTPLDLNGYEIFSAGGNLQAGNLDTLGGDAGFPAATSPGNGWQADGANDATQILETYLLGVSTFGVGETSLGMIFDGSEEADEDLTFRFSTEDGVINSLITYVGEFSAGTPGDFNGDGLVDGADYALWRNNLNAATDDPIGGNGDGVPGIDGGDLAVWLANYNPAGGPGAVAAAPEPSSLV
ncbi:MAG: LamG-like jellyroll fold domain-containing protein, partial [Planctomycetota bacterium]